MDPSVADLWPHAPAILAKLDEVVNKPKEQAKDMLMGTLGWDTSPQAVEDSKPGVEEFEYALHAAVMQRLEAKDEQAVQEVALIIEIAAEVVAELFERSAKPGTSMAETDRCKAWWLMLVAVAEDTTRLVPAKLLPRLLEVFEESLVQLQAASLKLAHQRLREFDCRHESEVKSCEDGTEDSKAAKEAKDKEAKRVDERKKLIGQLGISPNGHLYLTLTSLLKQLATRLSGSINSSFRARISLLLENLLALDHKAIANNQKLRTQDFVILDDLDKESNAVFGSGSAVLDTPEAAATEPKADTSTEAAPEKDDTAKDSEKADVTEEATKASSLGNDGVVDYALYRRFWGVQEPLQFVEKIFEKPENWQDFNSTISKLLGLFQKYPTPDYENQPWSEQAPAPLRQAPRSRGLGVQFDDPGFRIQFLTQIMIACQALEQDVSSRRDRAGLISVQRDTVQKEFRELKNSVEAVLTQTRKGYTKMLTHVLGRETHWVSWKGFGCREYERESLEMLNGKPLASDSLPEDPNLMKGYRPKLEPHVNSMLKTLKEPGWRLPSVAADTDEETLKASMRPSVMKRMCERNLERLETEDDPAQGIEDEYKAKKNKVFMWQARRLFALQHLRVYANKETYNKSDFMDFVRAAKKRNQPAAADGQADSNAAEADGGENEQPKPDAPTEASAPETAQPESAAAATTTAAATAEGAAVADASMTEKAEPEAAEPDAAEPVPKAEAAASAPAVVEEAPSSKQPASDAQESPATAKPASDAQESPAAAKPAASDAQESSKRPASAVEDGGEPPAKKLKAS
eukprot:TRINITY_DN3462_c1_g5_i1.p1 TRINITY_DN3462_c1_g5~~TRINITY_DN3462_c1_g5_i1.p1  ORF type:complete len:803 (-),score=209.98 TRINITY_DN3462_c1_g5_i1:106-2514(-)